MQCRRKRARQREFVARRRAGLPAVRRRRESVWLLHRAVHVAKRGELAERDVLQRGRERRLQGRGPLARGLRAERVARRAQ